MKDYLHIIQGTTLFRGIGEAETLKLLECTGAQIKQYEKNERLVLAGSEVTHVGIVLDGQGKAVKEDISGRQIIVTLLQQGSIFGDVLAASGSFKSPVTIAATEPLSVLLIPSDGIITRCPHSCSEHDQLLRNHIHVISEKHMALHNRLDCLTRPTVREKVLAFLSLAADGDTLRTFSVPFDRAGMAEYLNVERSALSRELSYMKRDGLIDYYKNTFKLL